MAALLGVGLATAPVSARPTIPLPPGRPVEAPKAEPAPPPPPPPSATSPAAAPAQPLPAPEPGTPNTPVTTDQACLERLEHLGAVARLSSEGQQAACPVTGAVELSGLADGIALKPPAMLNCATAEALVRWIAEAARPALRKALDAEVRQVNVAGSYACRTRNNAPGAPMSEHSLGNAVDLAGFALEGSRVFEIKPSAGEPPAQGDLRSALRRSACSYFTTVLGPGADPEHADHLHLDLRQRDSGYRICE